jgi:hypothetical protein
MARANNRKGCPGGGMKASRLWESVASYKALFRPKKGFIGPKNAYFWEINNE